MRVTRPARALLRRRRERSSADVPAFGSWSATPSRRQAPDQDFLRLDPNASFEPADHVLVLGGAGHDPWLAQLVFERVFDLTQVEDFALTGPYRNVEARTVLRVNVEVHRAALQGDPVDFDFERGVGDRDRCERRSRARLSRLGRIPATGSSDWPAVRR